MSGFERGDRLPDFRRPDHRGEPCLFYDLQDGRPLVLFVLGPAEAPAIRAALSALGRPRPAGDKLGHVVLVRSTPPGIAALLDGATPPCTLLADDGRLSAQLCGENLPAAGAITAFALDANLRVIARLEGHNTEALLADVARLYAVEQPAPQLRRQQAPVLFVPRVLDDGLCRDLIALFERDGGQPSGVAQIVGNQALWRPDPAVKMRRDYYLQEGAWLDRIKALLARRVLPEIQRCFHFQVTQHEVFKLVRYDADHGGYFRPHRDNESRDTEHRRFAMTLNLNTGEYEGGQLRFPEFGPDLYEAERGGAVVFSCSLLHEVIPVARGRRYALLSFFFGDAQSIAPIQYRTAAP